MDQERAVRVRRCAITASIAQCPQRRHSRREEARGQGIASLDQVRWAIAEASGTVSFIQTQLTAEST